MPAVAKKNYSLVQVPAADHTKAPWGAVGMAELRGMPAQELVRFVSSPAPIISKVDIGRWFAWRPVRDAYSHKTLWFKFVNRFRPGTAPTWYSLWSPK